MTSANVTPATVDATSSLLEFAPETTNSPVIIEWYESAVRVSDSPSVTFAGTCLAGDVIFMWTRERSTSTDPLSVAAWPPISVFSRPLRLHYHVVTTGEAGTGVTFTATNLFDGDIDDTVAVLVRGVNTALPSGSDISQVLGSYEVGTESTIHYLAGVGGNANLEAALLVSMIFESTDYGETFTTPSGWTAGVNRSTVWAGSRDARMVASTAASTTAITSSADAKSVSISFAIRTASVTKTAAPSVASGSAAALTPVVATGVTMAPPAITASSSVLEPHSISSTTLVTISPDTVDAPAEVPIVDEPMRINVNVLAATIWATSVVLINTSPSSRPTFTGHGKDGYKPKMTPAERRDAFNQTRRIYDLENP